MNDVIINKIQSIQRCIQRVHQEYHAAGDDFALDYSRQDAAILNITRACEQSIDLANYLIKQAKWGIPTSSAESFQTLANHGLIDAMLAISLKKMVGFRNIAIHEYQQLNMDIVVSVINQGLDDMLMFGDKVLAYKGLDNASK